MEEVKVAIIPYPIMPRAGSPTSENVWALKLGGAEVETLAYTLKRVWHGHSTMWRGLVCALEI